MKVKYPRDPDNKQPTRVSSMSHVTTPQINLLTLRNPSGTAPKLGTTGPIIFQELEIAAGPAGKSCCDPDGGGSTLMQTVLK